MVDGHRWMSFLAYERKVVSMNLYVGLIRTRARARKQAEFESLSPPTVSKGGESLDVSEELKYK